MRCLNACLKQRQEQALRVSSLVTVDDKLTAVYDEHRTALFCGRVNVMRLCGTTARTDGLNHVSLMLVRERRQSCTADEIGIVCLNARQLMEEIYAG